MREKFKTFFCMILGALRFASTLIHIDCSDVHFQEKFEGQTTKTRSTWLVVSVLVLTLLVSATTAAVIYMGMSQANTCSEQTGKDDSIIKADVHITLDGNDVSKNDHRLICTSSQELSVNCIIFLLVLGSREYVLQ